MKNVNMYSKCYHRTEYICMLACKKKFFKPRCKYYSTYKQIRVSGSEFNEFKECMQNKYRNFTLEISQLITKKLQVLKVNILSRMTEIVFCKTTFLKIIFKV